MSSLYVRYPGEAVSERGSYTGRVGVLGLPEETVGGLTRM